MSPGLAWVRYVRVILPRGGITVKARAECAKMSPVEGRPAARPCVPQLHRAWRRGHPHKIKVSSAHAGRKITSEQAGRNAEASSSMSTNSAPPESGPALEMSSHSDRKLRDVAQGITIEMSSG
jgi:hypothetical protein